MAIPMSACVYRMDIQQGNLLDAEQVEQLEVGMTRSQVRFLLGTPMVIDAFDANRWDYMYSLRHGRSREVTKRHLVVWAFAGGCLSGGTLIGVVLTEAGTREKAPVARAIDPPRVSTPAYLVVDDDADPPDDDDDTPNDAPPVTKTTTVNVDVPTETGSSVADLLVRLEVAYRQTLAAPQPLAAAPHPLRMIPRPNPEKTVNVPVPVHGS